LPLVKLIESFIATAICVVLNTESVDFLVDPVTSELTTIGPFVGAEAFNKTVFIISCVALVIRPFLHTVSIALVIDIIAVEGATVRPYLGSTALLGSLFELTDILEVVDVHASSCTMVLVVGPFSFVSLTFDVSELSVAVCDAKIPGALVRSTIPEAHDSAAMAEPTEPLTIIGCTAGAVAMDSNCELFL